MREKAMVVLDWTEALIGGALIVLGTLYAWILALGMVAFFIYLFV